LVLHAKASAVKAPHSVFQTSLRYLSSFCLHSFTLRLLSLHHCPEEQEEEEDKRDEEEDIFADEHTRADGGTLADEDEEDSYGSDNGGTMRLSNCAN
jgi:hypothetical protein